MKQSPAVHTSIVSRNVDAAHGHRVTLGSLEGRNHIVEGIQTMAQGLLAGDVKAAA
jgi:hypothetical protein